MPTVGRILAQFEKAPLKKVVQSLGGAMKPNGALTKAAKDEFTKAKVKLGLPKNASVIAVLETIQKQAEAVGIKIKSFIKPIKL